MIEHYIDAFDYANITTSVRYANRNRIVAETISKRVIKPYAKYDGIKSSFSFLDLLKSSNGKKFFVICNDIEQVEAMSFELICEGFIHTTNRRRSKNIQKW